MNTAIAPPALSFTSAPKSDSADAAPQAVNRATPEARYPMPKVGGPLANGTTTI